MCFVLFLFFISHFSFLISHSSFPLPLPISFSYSVPLLIFVLSQFFLSHFPNRLSQFIAFSDLAATSPPRRTLEKADEKRKRSALARAQNAQTTYDTPVDPRSAYYFASRRFFFPRDVSMFLTRAVYTWRDLSLLKTPKKVAEAFTDYGRLSDSFFLFSIHCTLSRLPLCKHSRCLFFSHVLTK